MGPGGVTRPSEAGSDARRLLERDAVMHAIGRRLDDALACRGGGVVVEGPAGIGKSAVLAEAVAWAAERGLETLQARAVAPLQRYPFGLLSSLLDTEVTTPAAFRTDPAVLDRPAPASAFGPDEVGALHLGVAAVADRADVRPLLLAVDDLQWSDEPSLRWLLFLVQRVGDLPVAVVVAARDHEREQLEPTLHQLGRNPAFDRIALRALSPGSVAEVVSARFPGTPPDVVDTVVRATRGNPFLVHRLLDAVAAERSDPGPLDLEGTEQLALDPVRDDLLVRVAPLGPCARTVLEAVAVLGDGANLGEIAHLADLDVDAAGELVDGLAARGVLEPRLPAGFVHPLVRDAVVRGIGPARRAGLHHRAARALGERHAPVARVAAHLEAAPITGDPWVVDQLAAAAREAMTGGAPATAARLLRRALVEPPSEAARVEVLVSLADAEAAAGDDAAFSRIEAAVELVDDATRRAVIRRHHGWMLFRAGRLDDAFVAFSRGCDAAAPGGPLHAELSCARNSIGALLGQVHPQDVEHDLLTDVGSWSGSALDATRREMAIQLAVARVFAGTDHAVARSLALRALGDGAMLREVGVTFSASVAISVLFWCDALEPALTELERALDLAVGSGDLALQAYVRFGRAQARYFVGDAPGAAADATAAAELWAGGWSINLAMARHWQARALLELDRPDDAQAALAERDPRWDAASEAAWSAARGRVALHRGDLETAASSFERTRELARDVPFLANPAGYPWRSDAAVAAHRRGDQDRVRELVDEDLRVARSFGAPRPLAIALRTAALTGDGPTRLALLDEAVDVLRGSPADLELATTLVELGAALRRSERRRAAREPLREALELAHRRGNAAVERRAMEELHASGARPRRRDVTGPGALTPTERRIVELATHGLSNRTIAQQLYVTRKTVEWHLGHAYAKLGVHRREDLGRALTPSATPGERSR
jgi:DNA-binding CsgD family transcriptional regulator